MIRARTDKHKNVEVSISLLLHPESALTHLARSFDHRFLFLDNAKWESTQSTAILFPLFFVVNPIRNFHSTGLPLTSFRSRTEWFLDCTRRTVFSFLPLNNGLRRFRSQLHASNESLPVSYASLGGSGQGCPLLRASNEHILIVRVLRARGVPGHSLLIPLRPRVAQPSPLLLKSWAEWFPHCAPRASTLLFPTPPSQSDSGLPALNVRASSDHRFIVGAPRAKREDRLIP